MSPNLEAYITRLSDVLGARLGRPSVHGGVMTMSRALAMSPENLAAIEAAWRSDRAGEPSRPAK